jgi:hypothetical protein
MPPLWRVHHPPRSNPSISCRVYKLVVNLLRLPRPMHYSGRINAYKLDRTTVTVGVLTVKIRQPSHEFTFGVGMSFIPYPLVLTPVV